ncbi:hypothetical protein PINS_up001091 [Pythium insidiosum]|nr:hypothetical protein PINS_up001091 [Pythium insidiosum]
MAPSGHEDVDGDGDAFELRGWDDWDAVAVTDGIWREETCNATETQSKPKRSKRKAKQRRERRERKEEQTASIESSAVSVADDVRSLAQISTPEYHLRLNEPPMPPEKPRPPIAIDARPIVYPALSRTDLAAGKRVVCRPVVSVTSADGDMVHASSVSASTSSISGAKGEWHQRQQQRSVKNAARQDSGAVRVYDQLPALGIGFDARLSAQQWQQLSDPHGCEQAVAGPGRRKKTTGERHERSHVLQNLSPEKRGWVSIAGNTNTTQASLLLCKNDHPASEIAQTNRMRQRMRASRRSAPELSHVSADIEPPLAPRRRAIYGE